MELKYSLKDVLLEAGVRDYRQIETDKGWEPSDKHLRIMKKIYKKEKSNSGITPFIKTLYGAAAAALLICFALAIKPVREGIASFFGINPNNPPVVVTTDEDTEKRPPVTDTETDTETETARPEPVTDEEKMAFIIDDIIDNGFTGEKWSQLNEYADKAFIYCFDTYFNTDCDNAHKCVYSSLCAQYLVPELLKYLPVVNGQDTQRTYNINPFSAEEILSSKSAAVRQQYAGWLTDYRRVVLGILSPYVRESEAYKNLYFNALMFNRLDFNYARAGSPDTPPEEYYPSKHLLNENLAYLKVHGLQSYKDSFRVALFNTENGVERLLDIYDKETDVKTKASISTLIAFSAQILDSEEATQGGRMTLIDFFGEESYAYLMSVKEEDIKKLDNNSDLTYYAEWLKNFVPMIEEAASKQPEQTVFQDRGDVCYKILQHIGFDNYHVENEFEKEAEEALSTFIKLLGRTFTGGFYADEIDKYYSNVDGADNPLPAALVEKIKKYVPEFDEYIKYEYEFTYTTAKDEDLRTLDGWRKKLYNVLDDKALADNILANENEDYLTLDGVIYLSTGPWEGGYTTYMSVMPGSVRFVEETDEYVTVTADIRWSKNKAETHTFNIRKTDGGLKLLTQGSFFDKYLKDGVLYPYLY